MPKRDSAYATGVGQEELTKVKVEICGESYNIKGNESEEHIKMIAAYVDKKMRQVVERNPRLSTGKVAVLAALNIADELSKLQEDYDSMIKIINAHDKTGE